MAEKVLRNAAQLRVNGNNVEIDVFSMPIKNHIDKNSRIINATLVLTVRSGANGSGFYVKAQSDGGDYKKIDFISPAANGDSVHLNITEEVNYIIKDTNEKAVIQIDGNIAFEEKIDLKIEYIPERIMFENNTYYDVSVGRAGDGKLNLATGGLSFVHEDSAVSRISHIYNAWQAGETGAYFDLCGKKQIIGEYGCGKGWKLNLHQYLVKQKGTATQDLYTYIDGNGNYHEFAEQYYYKANGAKHYVKKETVNINFDGKLTYWNNGNEHEIKTELKTTSGLTLQNNLNGFAGAEKLELRTEDRAQLEEDIESLHRTKSDCEFAVAEYRKAESAAYKSLLRQQERMEDESAELERRSIDSHYATEGLMNEFISKKSELEHYTKKGNDGRYLNYPGADYETKLDIYNTASEVVQNFSISSTPIDRNAEEKDKNGNITKAAYKGATQSELRAQKDASDALTAAQKQLNKTFDLLQQAIGEASSKIESINWEESKAVHAKRVMLQQMQAEFSVAKKAYSNDDEARQSVRNDELYERTLIDLKKAEKILDLKIFELKRLKEQEPSLFLTNNSNTILAFNEAGALIAIADAYENIVDIKYENGKLVGVSDTDGNITKLEYNDEGQLIKIVDADEKVIKFDYSENGNLTRVTYPDETISEYEYNELNLLQSANNPAGYGTKFSYDHQKVNKIEEITRTFEITDEGWRGLDAEETSLVADVEYVGFATTLTDRLKKSNTYIFDILGKPVTVYEGCYFDPEETTKSLSIDYSGTRQAFCIEDKIKHENWVPELNREGSLAGTKTTESRTEYIVYDINLPETQSFLTEGATDFVLSAWAQADSAFIPASRKTDYSCSNIDRAHIASADENKKKRKFELRAELTYDDGTERVFSANFDWLNTNWQYLALPVTINEQDKIGDRLTGSFPFVLGGEKRKLTRLKVIVDYGYNVNNLVYDCLTLRQGSWTYQKFDADGKTEYSEDSANGTVTRYEYNENGQVVKTITTDRQYRKYINTSEYNKQGRIVRKQDYNGLCEEIAYDDKGREVKTITYNISDPSSKYYSESVRDKKGKVTADIDITGEFNSAEYDFDKTGAANVIKDACGNKTAYGYYNDELVSVSSTAAGEENRNTITKTLGFTTKVSSGGTDYNFTYDGWGRQKDVLIAGEKYCGTEYTETKTDNTYIVATTLGSGEIFTSKSDNKGKVTETRYNGEIITQNTYDDESGHITCSIDNSGEKQYNTEYKYIKDGQLITKKQTETNGANIVSIVEQDIEYNRQGNIKRNTYNINDTEQEYGYGYDDTLGQRLRTVNLPDGTEQTIEYDGLNRTKAIRTGKLSKSIYYAKFGDHATNYVSSVWYGVDGIQDDNTRYVYDKKGNIVCIKENGKETVTYEYDELNRLISEKNDVFGEKAIEYDSNGNILTKTVNGARTEYSYRQNGWRDQLLSLRKKDSQGKEVIYSFEYDKIGNPVQMTRNGQAIEIAWEKGRQLARYNGHKFTYNALGIRTGKTLPDGTEITYYLDGAQILAEETRDAQGALTDTVYYQYGVDGITGFKHNGTTYLYRKNIQGDITHIYGKEASGKITLKAEYKYDGFGNREIIKDTNGIGEKNAFGYRGYYYDSSTNMYYLQSRYYSPELIRFLNADKISYLDPETLNGLNLYSYCGNNPIMLTDSTGTFALSIFLAFIIGGLIAGVVSGGIVGGTTAYNLAAETGATGWERFGWTVLGAFGGAVIGGIIGAVAGATIGSLFFGAAALGTLFGGGGFALAGGGLLSGGAALASVSVVTTMGVGIGIGFMGAGLVFMSKPNSGRIRYNDGTGKGTDGKEITDPDIANKAYKQLKDPIEKAKWKRWMKGKGFRTSHLKDLIFFPLVGEWFRRMFTGDLF